jgi:hypothetical protein
MFPNRFSGTLSNSSKSLFADILYRFRAISRSAWGLNPSLIDQVLLRGLCKLYLVVFKRLERLAQNFRSGRVRQQNSRVFFASWISIFYLFQLLFSPASALGKSSSCPTELEPLVEVMLPELPGYLNRELQRSRSAALTGSRSIGNPDASTYILLAGRPEFEPLPLGTARSEIGIEKSPEEAVYQAFITTLERTYINDEILEFQGYHWLFLTPSSSGWRLVLMFSSWGSYPADGKTTPPQDSSYSAMGQGIRTWLRDCQYSTNPE